MTAAQVVAEVMKDKAFFLKSGGGATLSGGEPLASPTLALDVARLLLAAGLRVAVETCLAVVPETLIPFLRLPLLWLVDLKQVEQERFASGTGGKLGPVLSNLRSLAASGAELELRIPLIPGFNDDDVSMDAILGFAASLPNPAGSARHMDFLPYHELALGKYALLDREYSWTRGAEVSKREVSRWAAKATALGFMTTTGG